MKLPGSLAGRKPKRSGVRDRKERGVALVIVMSILAVLTILVLAILTLTSNELASSKSYAEMVRARQISESVTSLVVGQIREATRPDANQNLFGKSENFLWACQPGMIRTYRSSGGFAKAFKLYSSSKMVVTDRDALLKEIETVRGWRQDPRRYVDLNAPVVKYNEKGEEVARHFPILDPRAKTIDGVEGLDWDVRLAGGLANHDLGAGRELPMPVEWIYLLADGSLGPLNSQGDFVGQGKPSEANPIVGRVAFWVDDESCKVNLNTASEGVPWSVPVAATEEGAEWSQKQPVTHEVQRYPGHPATTCLSSILFPGRYVDGEGREALTERELEAIYDLSPKVVHGGTKGGRKKASQPIEFDEDRLYSSVDEAVFNSKRKENAVLGVMAEEGVMGGERLHRARGLITVSSRAPELNIHGRPRMSLWPMHENSNGRYRTPYDQTMLGVTSMGNRAYFIKRSSPSSRHQEFYVRAKRNNSDLFSYIMSHIYQDIPGYGYSLAKKYGATRRGPFRNAYYEDETEYKLDHFSIALSMFDYIRGVNLYDPSVDEPYSRVNQSSSFGQIPGINLIGRRLDRDNGTNQQRANWFRTSLEPRGAGRIYTMSEVALVLYNTAEVRLDGIEDSRFIFSNVRGEAGDAEIIKRVVRNRHPGYRKWKPREYGPEDVGHTFHFIEVGMIPELFCPAQGFHQIHPRMALQLQTGGPGYLRGFDEEIGLRMNDVPLQLWGQSVDADTGIRGPMVSTVNPSVSNVRGDLPSGWYGWGGSGGYRILRFGEFQVAPDQPGWYGSQFLANGSQRLRALYCQTGVIVRDDEEIEIQQGAPVQFVLYDNVGERAGVDNLVQTFNIRWETPEETLISERPELQQSAYAGWTRRFNRAASQNARKDPVFILDDKGTECVKSMTLTHGDFRHLAMKRNVPSELFLIHPEAEKRRAGHSLTWSGPHGAAIAPGATFARYVFGRSLVEKARYTQASRPDFTFNPNDRRNFAPLMSKGYLFPIDPSITRDFENGTGTCPDGAYLRKADDGADELPGGSLFDHK
ncbi:MAG: Verru_Chthon cassette protein A, partial [Verrucomicrobiota bacterium]